jgi:hypothetical protein
MMAWTRHRINECAAGAGKAVRPRDGTIRHEQHATPRESGIADTVNGQ